MENTTEAEKAVHTFKPTCGGLLRRGTLPYEREKNVDEHNRSVQTTSDMGKRLKQIERQYSEYGHNITGTPLPFFLTVNAKTRLERELNQQLELISMFFDSKIKEVNAELMKHIILQCLLDKETLTIDNYKDECKRQEKVLLNYTKAYARFCFRLLDERGRVTYFTPEFIDITFMFPRPIRYGRFAYPSENFRGPSYLDGKLIYAKKNIAKQGSGSGRDAYLYNLVLYRYDVSCNYNRDGNPQLKTIYTITYKSNLLTIKITTREKKNWGQMMAIPLFSEEIRQLILMTKCQNCIIYFGKIVFINQGFVFLMNMLSAHFEKIYIEYGDNISYGSIIRLIDGKTYYKMLDRGIDGCFCHMMTPRSEFNRCKNCSIKKSMTSDFHDFLDMIKKNLKYDVTLVLKINFYIRRSLGIYSAKYDCFERYAREILKKKSKSVVIQTDTTKHLIGSMKVSSDPDAKKYYAKSMFMTLHPEIRSIFIKSVFATERPIYHAKPG